MTLLLICNYVMTILIIDTRETGFVNAITAAGVTYAVTRACTAGELVDCSCDKKLSRRHSQMGTMVNNDE